MNDMELRIDRGDMKLERAEAIKVETCIGLMIIVRADDVFLGNVPDCCRPFAEDFCPQIIPWPLIIKSVFFPSMLMLIMRLLVRKRPRSAVHSPGSVQTSFPFHLGQNYKRRRCRAWKSFQTRTLAPHPTQPPGFC